MSETASNTGAKPIDRKKKLGKGLGALLGETRREEPPLRPASGSGGSSPADHSAPLTAPTAGLASTPVAATVPLPVAASRRLDDDPAHSLCLSVRRAGA